MEEKRVLLVLLNTAFKERFRAFTFYHLNTTKIRYR